MGVPSFFKWVAKRYPKTVQEASEPTEEQTKANAAAAAAASACNAEMPPSTVGNNPVIDNLYLDMNGIIHPVRQNKSGTRAEKREEERQMAHTQRAREWRSFQSRDGGLE